MNKLNQEIQSITASIGTLEKELEKGNHTKEEEDDLIDKIIILRLELRKKYKQAIGDDL